MAIPNAPVKLASLPPPVCAWLKLEADLGGQRLGVVEKRERAGVGAKQRADRALLDGDADAIALSGEGQHAFRDFLESLLVRRHREHLRLDLGRDDVDEGAALDDADRIGDAAIEIGHALNRLDQAGHGADGAAPVAVGRTGMRGLAVHGHPVALEGMAA